MPRPMGMVERALTDEEVTSAVRAAAEAAPLEFAEKVKHDVVTLFREVGSRAGVMSREFLIAPWLVRARPCN